MACIIDSGRIVDCKDSLGGLKTVYIGNYIDMVSQTAFTAATADTVTAIGTQTFFEFELRPELSSLVVNYQADAASGTTFFEQVLSLTFQKLDATDIATIKELCQGRPNIWVLDNNQKCWLIGAEFGCNVSGGNIQTGMAYSDMSGFTMDLTGREQNPIWLATAGVVGDANYPLDLVTGATVTAA
tara:strand:- start:3476 stop:4030 length:555 start_codon:yes stop_codon:yes gene_type:complete